MKTTHKSPDKIKLAGQIVIIGPGTVPTSLASVSGTVIQDVISKSRIASKKGIFDSQIEKRAPYGRSAATSE